MRTFVATAAAVMATIAVASFAASAKTIAGVKLVLETVHGEQCYRFVVIETRDGAGGHNAVIEEYFKSFALSPAWKKTKLGTMPMMSADPTFKSTTFAPWIGYNRTGILAFDVGDMPRCEAVEQEAIRIQLRKALELLAPPEPEPEPGTS